MKITITPTYEDIFQESPEKIEDLLSNVPFNLVVEITALINSHLFQSETSIKVQMELFELISRRFSPQVKNKIFQSLIKISGNFKDKKLIIIFNRQYGLDLIIYLLKINHKNFDIEDSTPQQELNIFKAYLICSSISSNEINQKLNHQFNFDTNISFYKNTWPLLLKQKIIQSEVKKNILFEGFKAIFFLRYFELHPKYKNYFSNFLDFNKSTSSFTHTFNLLNIFLPIINKQASKIYFEINGYFAFLDRICLNKLISPIKDREYLAYDIIKKYPLYKVREGVYQVIDWDLFSKKIYNGLIFDFFEFSGIKAEIPSFDTYKSQIGKHLLEKILITLVNELLNPKKYDSFHYDFEEKNEDGVPDLYLRNGNKIFLFELKDTIMPNSIFEDISFESIENEVTTKFLRKKGIKQLINQIKLLNRTTFNFDDFEKKGIKKKNIKIYPILVFTDDSYNIAGINDFLNTNFQEKLSSEVSNCVYRKIQPLTFINISTFFTMGYYLNPNEVKLKDWIEDYWSTKVKKQKSLNFKPSEENLFRRYESFDDYLFNHTNLLVNKNKRSFDEFIEKILLKFDIKR